MKVPSRWMRRRLASVVTTIFILVAAIVALALIFKSAKLDTAKMFLAVIASISRISVAYVLSLGAALLFAVMMAKSKLLENLLLPVFDLFQSIPGLAILPLAVIYFGKGNTTAIFIIFLAMFWTMLFTIIGTLKGLKEDLSEAATIFGATGWKRFRYFTMPALLPAIITASIISWGAGWEIIIAAEIIGISTGIGAFLNTASESGQTSLVVVGIMVLAIVVFMINKFIWLPLLHKTTKYQTE